MRLELVDKEVEADSRGERWRRTSTPTRPSPAREQPKFFLVEVRKIASWLTLLAFEARRVATAAHNNKKMNVSECPMRR